jgi:hypothetical protein
MPMPGDTTVSTIEDVRKLFQDFLGPELRALTVRVESLEKADVGIQRKLGELAEKLDKKFDTLSSIIASNHNALMQQLDLARRVEQLEHSRARPAKENA